jgi:hypothetical protein
MKRHEYVLAAVVLLSGAGCQQSRPPVPAQDRAADLQKINQLRDQFAAA